MNPSVCILILRRFLNVQILPVRQSGISVYQLDIRFQIFISIQFFRCQRIIQEIEGLNRKFPGNKKGTDVEMKISIPRASYASYALGKYVEQVRDEELRLHIRECNSVQALDNLTKKHYNLALIRMEDKYEEYYYSIIHLRGLEYEKIMDFQYRLVVNENDPLATKKLNGYEDLEPYIELIHGDSRLPNGEYLDIKETPENQNAHRRIILINNKTILEIHDFFIFQTS